MRESQLAGRLSLLVAVFAGLFLVFGFTTWRTLEQVRVKGPIYTEIVLGKDLIADVLPPPAYIIESYLLTLQMVDETDPTRISQLIERGDQLRLDFESRQEFWKRTLDKNELGDLMTVQANRAAIEFFRVRDEQFVPAVRAGDRDRARALLVPMGRSYDTHRRAIDRVVEIATQNNINFERVADEVIGEQSRTLLILGGAILLVVGFMAVYANRSARQLSSRIQMAADVAHRVASGDLATEVPPGNDTDEAGRLLKAISGMTQSLRALVTRAKQASIELMSTATEFAATSRQQEATVQSFGASTNQIAAAVKQINATSAELLSTMEGVNAVASQTADLAEDGQAGLRNLDTTMDRLAQAANTMAARLAAIREEAAEITGVVTTISKVADQTNLLSINAAIEAEKAGEQGLGFLVLAREIRRLADQTAVATLDIEQMVKQMQNAVSAGVMEIDRFAEEVRSGVGNVVRVGGQFGQIISQVKTLSERFDAVNHGMRSQGQGARQIGDAMGQLIDGARQTSVSLREFNSATESLRDAVSVLKQEIAQFNVGN
ncbi:methyl-accepting chemotaxis protein [Arenimonas sp. MALMAid1274]|uniref:methyl-accepting chemotaxis protein n=1 Tax=Arenimonas sp. MALMAid1274 TaxID=3411630 RepID=UPI003BA21D25